MSSAVIFQTQSFLILVLMYIGVAFRKNRALHVKMMASAIVWDILLILQIELTRSAIDKASKAVSNPMMLNIHVSLAVLCVILYGFMMYTGRKIIKGNGGTRPLHKKLGLTTLVTRTLVFITSFWAVV